MILAAAQTQPKRGDIEANLVDHYRLIKLAAEKGAHLIVFPEMSITGYERENATKLAFAKNDSRLDHLRKLSVEHNIIIVVGAPIQINEQLFISEFIIAPDHSIKIYTKQFLHQGEDEFFQPSLDHNPMILIDDQKISFAICADIDNPLHPENAGKKDTSIYIASIFFSPSGVPNAYRDLQNYAQKYKMNILMSNFSGASWGHPSGGKSAFWNNKGELVAQMNDSDSGLLLVENQNDHWTSQIIKN
ncbi:carbon-nitrogen hydrolase family protein [Flavobacterium sp. Fl-77]|uniref:Carbon-nitrogen hydrolase family protein n=1 Tax=Flavobacterium flavipigmentatum TaxID=2893884 RepID=A0AAJ2SI75_9FLAO|nr:MULTISPECIES: carbon-nitrogen hydrolase family protein [unclassified Flavobacterium]MDX6183385.1 carbon-nitrogen hydrolase family protein [Flavobacterium sp. Fl-33]MDX6186669.1 carbon-nitrogen hydrolase family protein [Flavobacterium sp. Fl-77]UFH38563.1 carbon-nitrogen hydrolase family protein [Flavobacterium sp. F-70]